MFTVPKIIKGLPIIYLNDIFGIDLDKEIDAILQCLQSNFNLMNALGKQA